MNLGSNLGFNLGSKPGFEPGFKPGFKRGLESGFEPGLNPRLNLGLNLGWNLGSEPGFLGCCCSPPPPPLSRTLGCSNLGSTRVGPDRPLDILQTDRMPAHIGRVVLAFFGLQSALKETLLIFVSWFIPVCLFCDPNVVAVHHAPSELNGTCFSTCSLRMSAYLLSFFLD